MARADAAASRARSAFCAWRVDGWSAEDAPARSAEDA